MVVNAHGVCRRESFCKLPGCSSSGGGDGNSSYLSTFREEGGEGVVEKERRTDRERGAETLKELACGDDYALEVRE
jgi:hypothetical protein